MGSLKSKVLKGTVQLTDPVMKATYSTFRKVTLDTTLRKLDRILDKEHFALVVHSQRLYISQLVGLKHKILAAVIMEFINESDFRPKIAQIKRKYAQLLQEREREEAGCSPETGLKIWRK